MVDEGSFGLVALLLGAAFLPVLAVTVTAFAKIAVVIFIVRQALGIQQLPPNIILYGLSLILAAYVSMPVLNEAWATLEAGGFNYQTMEEWSAAGQAAMAPLKEFLLKHTEPGQLEFFASSTTSIWGEGLAENAAQDSMAVLVPAFLLSELTRAFEIGLLLYLPFIAIDLIVTTLLAALGMMMVSPTAIAIPFKLMLFVFLDGWTKLVQGLVLTYA